MAIDVRLPKLSDEMAEGTISRWLKTVGESVDAGEPLVEVETEKVIVEVEAPRAGVIVEIVAPEQTVVPVDGLLCRIGAPGERMEPSKRPRQAAKPAPAARQAPPAAPEAPQATAPAAAASNVVPLPPRPAPAGRAHAGAVPVAASPLARRVAEELGIDLTAVPGSGSAGKVVVADLQPYLGGVPGAGGTAVALAAAPATAWPTAAPPRPQEAGVTEVPHSSLRRTIARRMSEAKAQIPHFYMTAEADVTRLLHLRESLHAALPASAPGAEAPGRVSVNDLLLKATAAALRQVPELNATYSDQAVLRHAAVHIGFATAIDEGLVTPVVRDCHAKTVGAIARETQALIARAHARTLTAADLQGATFTISNLGMYDVVEFAAIINPPQVGILAIARPVEQPAAGDAPVRRLLRATLSADHRAVDGATGARFLQAFKGILEHPERMLL